MQDKPRDCMPKLYIILTREVKGELFIIGGMK